MTNEAPYVPDPLWGLWTQQTSLSTSSGLGILGATNLLYCSWLSPLHATNLPRWLVILATLGLKTSLTTGSCLGPLNTTNLPQPLLLFGTSGHNKPSPALAPVWDLWKQRTYPSPCSCLGPLDTTNLPQPLLPSGTFGHNKPTPALAPVWGLLHNKPTPALAPPLGPLDSKNSNSDNVAMNSDAAQAVSPKVSLQHTNCPTRMKV